MEAHYRQIDQLSGELAAAYMMLEEAEEAKHKGRLALRSGSPGDLLGRGLEMLELREGTQQDDV